MVQSILFYGTPIWGGALRMKKYCDMLINAQRKSLLRIASAYGTTFAAALQVITDVVPTDPLVEEKTTIYETESQVDRDSIRRETIEKWQH